MTSGWRLWHFNDSLIHIVENETLSNLLHDEMARRGHFLSKPEELPTGMVQGGQRTEAVFDLGGIYHRGEPRETFHWAGLEAHAPSRHVPGILRHLDGLPLRRFESVNGAVAARWVDAARLYYKLKIWHSAWVMSPASYAQLVQQLVAIEPTSTRRYAEFSSQANRGRESTSD